MSKYEKVNPIKCLCAVLMIRNKYKRNTIQSPKEKKKTRIEEKEKPILKPSLRDCCAIEMVC